MKLNAINWQTITREQAKRMLGAASAAERRAMEAWREAEESGDESAFQAAESAYWPIAAVEENLWVFALCGERPEKESSK